MALSQNRMVTGKKFLDASVVPVEKALLARAEALEEQSESPGLNRVIADEFRKLAEELHHW